MFTRFAIGGIQLDAAGLVALADLDTIARRTALIGSASFLDVLYLAPGIHCQQDANEINRGERPQTVNMCNNYVFHLENPATVSYLQRIGKPGHLTTVKVSEWTPYGFTGLFGQLWRSELLATLLFLVGLAVNAIVIVLLGLIHDWWAIGVLGMLMLARFVNVVVIKLRQDVDGFKGAKEDEFGDLLIILSQDRWIRMQGTINDLKAVTAGQWLRESEKPESFAVSFGTLLVYCAAALAGNASTVGSLLMACLLLFSVGVLGLSNAATRTLHMFGHTVSPTEPGPIRYPRRLAMVDALLQEWPDKKWAINMSLMSPGQIISLNDNGMYCPGRRGTVAHTPFPDKKPPAPEKTFKEELMVLSRKLFSCLRDRRALKEGERPKHPRVQSGSSWQSQSLGSEKVPEDVRTPIASLPSTPQQLV